MQHDEDFRVKHRNGPSKKSLSLDVSNNGLNKYLLRTSDTSACHGPEE